MPRLFWLRLSSDRTDASPDRVRNRPIARIAIFECEPLYTFPYKLGARRASEWPKSGSRAVTSDKERHGRPAPADKFKQSARGRLLWPGMTNSLQIVASPIDAVPMQGVFDAPEGRCTLAFQLCDLDGHGVFRCGDGAWPPHPLAALLHPLALLQPLAVLLRVLAALLRYRRPLPCDRCRRLGSFRRLDGDGRIVRCQRQASADACLCGCGDQNERCDQNEFTHAKPPVVLPGETRAVDFTVM